MPTDTIARIAEQCFSENLDMALQSKCLLCSEPFVPKAHTQHICDMCDKCLSAVEDGEVEAELNDPALKARIKAGVKERLEAP